MLLATHARQTARRLWRSPMFTVTTLLTLALGVGTTTAIFSLVYGVLFKPLPYADADRLVGVWQTAPGLNIKDLNASPATYFLYREEGKTFEDIALYSGGDANITGLAEPERVPVLFVTDGLLSILRVQPAVGRFFTRTDDSPRTPETVVLTHGYWKEKFGGDPSVIGRTLQVSGVSREIIGVLPEGFTFMDRRFSLLLPQRFDPAQVFIGNFSYQALARLKAGISIEQANADVARMLPMLSRHFKPAPGMSLKMLEDVRMGPNVRPLLEDVIGDIARTLWVLMATVGIVLLIACANVANLLLVRVEGRQREIAVRSAMGASWGQIAKELLGESLILGTAGGGLGLLLAAGALQLLQKMGPQNVPRLAEVGLDWPVLLFATLVSLLSGILFGLAPVFKYAGANLEQALRSGGRAGTAGRERHRMRNTLVVGQVALALVLLVGAGLMLRTLMALQQVDPGFRDPAQLLTLRVSIPNAVVSDPKQVALAFQSISQKITAIPGVTAVALSSSVTMDGALNNDPIFAEGIDYGDKLPKIRRYKHLSPGYFQTLGNRMLAGRDFDWTDVMEMRPVVIVSDNLARELWGSPGAALGKRIRERPTGTWREVVGVAAQERDNGVHRDAPEIVYWPYLKTDFWNEKVRVNNSLVFAIRSARTGTTGLLNEVRQAVWAVNPNLPLAQVRSMQEIYDRSMARTSFTLVLLAIAAGMALILGVIGIYGVISYSVAQRTKEIGIRIALGAEQSAVRRLFVGQGMILVSIGVATGLAAAVALSQYLATLLYGVPAIDLATYATVTALLMGVAALATYLPARRAAAVEPVESLRAE